MLRRIALALAILAQVEAQDLEWSRKDTIMECAFLGLLAVDYLQTRDLITNPKHREPGRERYEQNLILGPHPTISTLNQYTAFCAAGHVVISMMLPQGKWRTNWQGFGIALEAVVIANNYRLGMRIKW